MFRTMSIAVALPLCLIATAALSQTPPREAQPPTATRALLSNVTRLYQFTGVVNSASGPETGTATSITCTNFADYNVTVRYVLRRHDGTQLDDQTVTLERKMTRTYSTKLAALTFDSFAPPESARNVDYLQGSIVVASNETEILCTGWIVDASSSVPNGIALHTRRFSPLPGTEE